MLLGLCFQPSILSCQPHFPSSVGLAIPVPESQLLNSSSAECPPGNFKDAYDKQAMYVFHTSLLPD